jgi:hypothetical protein
VNTGANDYQIYAPTYGVIHKETPNKEGMALSAGSPTGQLSRARKTYLEIIAMVTRE